MRGMIGALGPITQGIYPHVSILAESSRAAATNFLRKALLGIGGVFLLLSMLLLSFTRQLAFLVFGEGAAGSLSTLRWIALLPFVLAVSTVLATLTMIPFGLERQLSRIYVFAGLISLACCIPRIRVFGA